MGINKCHNKKMQGPGLFPGNSRGKSSKTRLPTTAPEAKSRHSPTIAITFVAQFTRTAVCYNTIQDYSDIAGCPGSLIAILATFDWPILTLILLYYLSPPTTRRASVLWLTTANVKNNSLPPWTYGKRASCIATLDKSIRQKGAMNPTSNKNPRHESGWRL